jgi:hypothetical protein
MLSKEINYVGSLRITNSKTLQRWKDLGWYQREIDNGYIFAVGCGRFRKKVCNCSKCIKKTK